VLPPRDALLDSGAKRSGAVSGAKRSGALEGVHHAKSVWAADDRVDPS
jgi:hypothetical protein